MLPKFSVRLIEEMLVSAAAAFLGALEASGYDFTRAGIGAAVGAVVRVLYGIVVKPVGQDSSRPSVK